MTPGYSHRCFDNESFPARSFRESILVLTKFEQQSEKELKLFFMLPQPQHLTRGTRSA